MQQVAPYRTYPQQRHVRIIISDIPNVVGIMQTTIPCKFLLSPINSGCNSLTSSSEEPESSMLNSRTKKSKLLIENKLIICALVYLHYKI